MSKILVVDDMQAELELICQYLTKAGYTTLTASNGEEALNKARENQPDAIVTDWMMPVMGGLELCRHLKKQPETANIPIVACTVKNRDVDRIWAIKQGVEVYLTKPYTAEQLVSAIEEVIG
ncbi:response regulator [Merismopedia glauca]|uniref:Two-component system response regulator n=1 Tax=Merismopedia glauca CCAP 1448/3 TaxID=1296344 RepID=A0A2T1BXR3_9CYAN|nr:response regulator [Merismopedia glauca]PSB00805.1 two-component system response regulator [Merismopedia glauca CCAP 1448/3]